MRKFLLLLAILACVVSSNAFAGTGFDYYGVYSIGDVTITPPGEFWDGDNPANLVEGIDYSVELDLIYNAAEGNDDLYYNMINTSIAFSDSGTTFEDVANASQIETAGTYFGTYVANAQYTFFFDVTATEEMIGDVSADISFSGTKFGLDWHEIGATGELPVTVSDHVPDVTASTPEPTAMLLLGTGFLGLLGVLRRKRKA